MQLSVVLAALVAAAAFAAWLNYQESDMTAVQQWWWALLAHFLPRPAAVEARGI